MRLHAKAVIATAVMLLTLALGVTFAGAAPPVLSIESTATDVSPTSAKVSGTIDPLDQETNYYFEYSKDPDGEGWTGSTAGGTLAPGSGPTNVSDEITGLKADTEYFVRLFAYNIPSFEEASTSAPYLSFTTDPVVPPTVTIDSVSSITDNSAHFSGTINPNAPVGNPPAYDVKWHFECTPACPSVEFSESFEPVENLIPADSVNHAVSADATGLDPNTTYEVRLVAENAGPPANAKASFKTSAVSPVVKALPPAVITDTSAWIGAKVNPRNSATTYYVEYSTDSSFDSSIAPVVKVPATEDASAGSGNSLVLVNHHAKELQPGTTYYYRVVASGAGPTTGEVESFETRAQPLPVQGPGLSEGRVYEKVSVAEKNGGDISFGDAAGPFNVGHSLAKAASGGDAVLYASRIPFGGAASGSTGHSYLARRTARGWTTKPTTPRMDPAVIAGFLAATYLTWASDDLSRMLVNTPAALNPGDLSGVPNLYLYEEATNTYRSIPVPGAISENAFVSIEAASKDGEHVVFKSTNLDTSNINFLWMWDGTQARRVDVLPPGTPFTHERANFGAIPGEGEPDPTALSADGSVVFFKISTVDTGVYVREFSGESASTAHVSGSERTGENPLDPQPAKFELASSDGSVAFFTSEQPLTDESEVTPDKNGTYLSPTLYRWEADAPAGERLTDIASPGSGGKPGVLGAVGASEDASVVYFAATAKLTPEATAGTANLYEWREDTGEIDLAVGGLRAPDSTEFGDREVWGDEEPQVRVSPDGRYLAFTSREALTAYDTNGTLQVYLYDNQEDQLTCVSCSTIEPRSRKSTWISARSKRLQEEGESQDDALPGDTSSTFHRIENMSPDGSRSFFNSKDALVQGDSNGMMDIYQWKEGGLSLISTGDSSEATRLMDHSVDGTDVFFATPERLVPSDVDNSWDLYDARVGGVAEKVERAPCIGDECQGTPSPLPNFVTPNSAAYRGTGNVGSERVTCGKAKVRRNGKCVKPKKKAKKAAKKKAAKKAKHARNGRNG